MSGGDPSSGMSSGAPIDLAGGKPQQRRPHQHPACGGQGSGRREPFSKTAFLAMAYFGSSTWIRQDYSCPGDYGIGSGPIVMRS
jgi:hypothetical protein